MPLARILPIMLAFTTLVAACTDAPLEDPLDSAREIEQPGESGLIPGTPYGGLGQWISDIRTGIRTLPAMAATPARARQAALDLYGSRFEYIRLYYGSGGRLKGGPALSAAVSEAEARFRDLIQMFLASPPPDAAAIRTAVEALDAALATVFSQATAAAVPMIPWAAFRDPPETP